MSHNRKRSHNESPPPTTKKPHHPKSPTAAIPTTLPQQQPQPNNPKPPTFPSYLETPNLPPKIKLLCQILSTTSPQSLESTLTDTGISISSDDVESVLKLSYSLPGPAVKFFRWAGHRHLAHRHSPYSWNLIIDLLGKNLLFDAMWDAVKSMRSQSLLSLATFASVFSSYVAAGRVDEAIMTFEVMDQYGCPRDVVALNSLLSAICRDGKTAKAQEFFDLARAKVRPDADTYAILLEGWENEGNVQNIRRTFGEMVVVIGWDPMNVPAYDSFLNTLLKGPGGAREALKFVGVMKEKRCYPGTKFFRNAFEECFKTSDADTASELWEEMKSRDGCVPDTQMYNSMIALQWYRNKVDIALRLFDEMAFKGAFPNEQTYNVMLQFLLKNRKLRDAEVIFDEMVKNECLPNNANCEMAIRVFLGSRDPDTAIKIWKCMVGNNIGPLESSANFLVVDLPFSHRLPEAKKYAEDMIERGIKLNSSTLSKLKQSLVKVGKGDLYDQLLRKWKSH
ncbi:pentatricopeptide repeat-containing protein At1g77360, mitochondrial-like [Magnolia sinica]|uniref:pentatricopeptide repeat-containing protein At1g77360, mitochondrial-like n=1 Tax=Magnolia sinica TaxID=86752 RepID=UPI002658974B|nr:pentatricopeptide repeat-containing protein At1g77360, mitochondrial-like [Magnolia sinica]